jgi:uncharacterized membrane protein YphA (DoxX/SURF4 family)
MRMTHAYGIVTLVSVIVFLYSGVANLFANGMAAEFERYGLSRFRLLTGAVELLGALGLVAGQFFNELVPISAGGLSLLMALAVVTRVRAGDSLVQTLPAGVLMLLNAFLTVRALGMRHVQLGQ